MRRYSVLNSFGGRLASARSKTGDPACSNAVSQWNRARHSGAALAAEVFKILAGCRAKARAARLAAEHGAAGRTLRAAVWHKRASRAMSGAERRRASATLREKREREHWKANVTIGHGALEEAEGILGRKLEPRDFAKLTGLPMGARVEVERSPLGVSIIAGHPAVKHMYRVLKAGPDGAEIKNVLFVKKQPGNKGFGLRAFAGQVRHARSLGVKRIKMRATRAPEDDRAGPEKWNGYYVWPYYGADGPVPDAVREKLRSSELPAELRHAENVQGLMSSPPGRKWWADHGETFDAVFDLNDGSPSIGRLTRHLKSRGVKIKL